MSGIARQHGQIDAQFGQRPSPFPIVIGSEHDFVIRRNAKPAIGLDLSIKLTWRPTGIPEGEEAFSRSLILADGAQDIEGRSYTNIAVYSESGLLPIVGRMEHKASARFHRASEMHRTRVSDSAR